MIYQSIRRIVLSALRAPVGPPPAPPGSPGSVEVFRASPRYLAQRLVLHLGSALSIVGFEVFAWFLSPESTWLSRRISVAVIVMTALAAGLRYLIIRLEYDLRYYMLTDQCLRIRRGAMIIEESTYTLANVQTVSLRQGPLDRLFGICRLHIETAGGGANETSNEADSRMYHHGRLEGINAKQATVLRDRLLKRLTEFQDSGLGDAQDFPGRQIANLRGNRPSELSTTSLSLLQEIGAELAEINQRQSPQTPATQK